MFLNTKDHQQVDVINILTELTPHVFFLGNVNFYISGQGAKKGEQGTKSQKFRSKSLPSPISFTAIFLLFRVSVVFIHVWDRFWPLLIEINDGEKKVAAKTHQRKVLSFFLSFQKEIKRLTSSPLYFLSLTEFKRGQSYFWSSYSKMSICAVNPTYSDGLYVHSDWLQGWMTRNTRDATAVIVV